MIQQDTKNNLHTIIKLLYSLSEYPNFQQKLSNYFEEKLFLIAEELSLWNKLFLDTITTKEIEYLQKIHH